MKKGFRDTGRSLGISTGQRYSLINDLLDDTIKVTEINSRVIASLDANRKQQLREALVYIAGLGIIMNDNKSNLNHWRALLDKWGLQFDVKLSDDDSYTLNAVCTVRFPRWFALYDGSYTIPILSFEEDPVMLPEGTKVTNNEPRLQQDTEGNWLFLASQLPILCLEDARDAGLLIFQLKEDGTYKAEFSWGFVGESESEKEKAAYKLAACFVLQIIDKYTYMPYLISESELRLKRYPIGNLVRWMLEYIDKDLVYGCPYHMCGKLHVLETPNKSALCKQSHKTNYNAHAKAQIHERAVEDLIQEYSPFISEDTIRNWYKTEPLEPSR